MLPTVKLAGVQVATAHVAEFELQVKFELVVSVLGLVFAAVEMLTLIAPLGPALPAIVNDSPL